MGFPIKAAALRHRRLAVAAVAILVSAGAVLAQADSDGTMRIEAPPITGLGQSTVATRGGERARSLRLEFAAKTVSFGIADRGDAITARDIPFAPGAWEVAPETRRAMAELRKEFRAKAPKDAAFALVVTGGDEVVAYRRARALRGELTDRHREDPTRIIAAAGSGGGDGQNRARVELILLDPARCEGCGSTPLKTIALDSGVAKLVRASNDGAMIAAAPATIPTPVTVPAPDPVVSSPLPPPRPAEPRSEQARAPKAQDTAPALTQRDIARAEARHKRRAALAERQERAREVAREDETIARSAPPRPARVQPRREARALVIPSSDYEPQRRVLRSAGGCGRPDIIIDDYYPGGPLVGCDGRLRRRR